MRGAARGLPRRGDGARRVARPRSPRRRSCGRRSSARSGPRAWRRARRDRPRGARSPRRPRCSSSRWVSTTRACVASGKTCAAARRSSGNGLARRRRRSRERTCARGCSRATTCRCCSSAARARSRRPAPEVFWSERARRGVIVAANLAPLPTDRQYELWVFQKGKPDRRRRLRRRPPGPGPLRVDGFPANPQAQNFAVTVEPRGGVPAPTGPIVLVGSPSA